MDEADIDPDKPAVDLQAQQQELLNKSIVLTEAFEQEQLFQLYQDYKQFLEYYKKYRNAYFIRIASLSIFCLGMIFLILSFALYYSDNRNARNEYETCITENSWSKWKLSSNDYFQKERCNSIQYASKECPKCSADEKRYQTTQPLMEEINSFVSCTKDAEGNSKIYVRHKI